MTLSFGIFALVLGIPFLVMGVFRVAFSRAKGLQFALGGVGLVGLGIVLLHLSEGKGHFRATIGLVLILVGLSLGVLGCWIGFWGPLAARNSAFGIKFIVLGAVIATCGILVIALPLGSAAATTGGETSGQTTRVWDEFNTYRVGPIPFPLVALVAMLAVNGLGLKRGLAGKRLIGANLIMIACIAVCYALLVHARSQM